MKRRVHARKFLAWTLCLVMLASLAVPVLAVEEDAPPAAPVEAPAAKAEAPAAKAEAPVEKAEVPVKDEAPAEKAEAPAKDEVPAEKAETPIKDEAPAEKADTSVEGKDEADTEKVEAPVEDKSPAKTEAPAVKPQVPADDEESPAQASKAPAKISEVPVKASEAPVASAAPVEAEPEEVEEPDEPEEEVGASLFSLGRTVADDDGFIIDWSQEDVVDSGWGSKHGVVQTSRGYYLYFDTAEWGDGIITVTTPSHPNTWQPAISFISVSYDDHLLNGADNRAAIDDDGVEISHYTSGGHRYTEAFVPAELFPEEDLTFLIGNGTVLATFAAEIGDEPDAHDDGNDQELDEPGEPTVLDPNAAYTGIVIDGDFSDWDAVPRYDMGDTRDVWGNEKNYDTVDQAAMVWDGDWVYILLVAEGDRDWQGNLTGAGNWTSVCGGGPHNNGQYAIVTDLNGQLLVQPTANNNGSIAGVDGAQVAVNTTQWNGAPFYWEIAIPASELPDYQKSIGFGFYLAEPVITGVTDLQGGDDTDRTFNGIIFDGNIQDWAYYPQTTIEYATSGTQDVVRDARGALWSDGDVLYGYAATNMQAHLDEKGGCFLDAISLAFNGNRDYVDYPNLSTGNFYPRILDLDSGSLDALNDGTRLENGDYTFYIFDTRTDPIYQFSTLDENNTATHVPNAEELKKYAFGKIKVHVDGVFDYAEFELYLDRVAEYIQQDGDTAFKTIDIQWGKLGQQWITYAGTPTGPILGVALAVGAIGAPMCYTEVKKRRGARKSKDEAEAK